jgi:HSP20 family protein
MSDKTGRSVATTSEARPRRWDPFSMLSDMESEMDRMFGHRFPFMHNLRRVVSPGQAWSPSTDVFEAEGQLVVKTELPGVNREDISVTVEGGDLVIKGERKSEEEVEEESYYRMERFTGSFYRRLPLPEGIDEDQINAEYKDGVLEVRVPKPSGDTDVPDSRRITVR